MSTNLFNSKISPEEIRKIIDFNTTGGTYSSLEKIQSEGVAALYNILCKYNFAYLADEVGMGKTYQALGLASIVWSYKPDARIVIISPRENLQAKWARDYYNFYSINYRKHLNASGDDIQKSILLKTPIIQSKECENLWEFAEDLFEPERKSYFLRHSSFRSIFRGQSNDTFGDRWISLNERMKKYGLFYQSGSDDGKIFESDSHKLSFRFASAFNSKLKKLGGVHKSIDLLIIDEAQYLRHPFNLGNTVLRDIFNNQVKKWLFLSATPLHSSRDDIRNQINEYAHPDFISEEDVQDPSKLQKKMQLFMIRRPRTYHLIKSERDIKKNEYRDHQVEGFRITKHLPFLATALVQKELVNILDGKNNRFRIGFLASFESLVDSVRHFKERDFPIAADDNENNNTENELSKVKRAPDEIKISSISREFKEQFGISLPHPKIEHIAQAIWKDAYLGNNKYLIFVRRTSSVKEIREELEEIYFNLVQSRIKQCWDKDFSWKIEPKVEIETEIEDEEEIEKVDINNEEQPNQFRVAMAQGGWLYKFRQKFRNTAKHALFFEENLLRAICKKTNTDLEVVIGNIPENILQDADEYSRTKKRKINRVNYIRYITCQLIAQHPSLLQISIEKHDLWKNFLIKRFPDELSFQRHTQSKKTSVSIRNEDLLSIGFWEHWYQNYNYDGDLGIKDPVDLIEGGKIEEMIDREIKKNAIGQFIRLSDSVVDLYYSELNGNIGTKFFEYLNSKQEMAVVLTEKLKQWNNQFELILTNSLLSSENNRQSLAKQGAYSELNEQMPVIGISGDGVSKNAIKQFKTPGLPQILVSTDVLKEGEDLHIFCDKVIHYGLAWTPGDMEQRVGRIDRYFSLIERKLQENEDPVINSLQIQYPYLYNSIEKLQVDRVVRRQKEAEVLMEYELGGAKDYSDYIDLVEQMTPRTPMIGILAKKINPYLPKLNNQSDKIPCIPKGYQDTIRNKYQTIVQLLLDKAKDHNITVIGQLNEFNSTFTFSFKQKTEKTDAWTGNWNFVPELGKYCIKLKSKIDETEYLNASSRFALEEEVKDKVTSVYKSVRLFFDPNYQSDIKIAASIDTFYTYLKESYVKPENDELVIDKWISKLRAIAINGRVIKRKKNKLEFLINLEERKQGVTFYCYEGMILITSKIAEIKTIERLKNISIPQYIKTENSKITFGYLAQHEGFVEYCKRYFYNELPEKMVLEMVKETARRADRYELKFTGKDDY